MKIEGMQYTPPVRPVGHRGAHSHHDVDISDDAVYFEPDERRQKEQQQHESEGEKPQSETLEQQVSSEEVKVAHQVAAASPIKDADKKDAHHPLDITA